MPPTIPNADFEEGGNWSFDGSGGFADRCCNFSFLGVCPRHGSYLAWLTAWTTSGNDCPFPSTQITGGMSSVTAGRMIGHFDVEAFDADYYSLEGWAHGGQEGFQDEITDYASLLVFLDGVFWGSVGIIFGNFLGFVGGWGPFNYALSWQDTAYEYTGGAHSVYLSPGTHELMLVARTPHLNVLGDPLPSARRQIVVIDYLSLQRQTSGVVLAGTTPPPGDIRLIHAEGPGSVRLVKPEGAGTVRLVRKDIILS